MNWQEVCADPWLHDLPYKIKLNEQGQILMSPVRLYHSAFQGEIIRYLTSHHGWRRSISFIFPSALMCD